MAVRVMMVSRGNKFLRHKQAVLIVIDSPKWPAYGRVTTKIHFLPATRKWQKLYSKQAYRIISH